MTSKNKGMKMKIIKNQVGGGEDSNDLRNIIFVKFQCCFNQIFSLSSRRVSSDDIRLLITTPNLISISYCIHIHVHVYILYIILYIYIYLFIYISKKHNYNVHIHCMCEACLVWL